MPLETAATLRMGHGVFYSGEQLTTFTAVEDKESEPLKDRGLGCQVIWMSARRYSRPHDELLTKALRPSPDLDDSSSHSRIIPTRPSGAKLLPKGA